MRCAFDGRRRAYSHAVRITSAAGDRVSRSYSPSACQASTEIRKPAADPGHCHAWHQRSLTLRSASRTSPAQGHQLAERATKSALPARRSLSLLSAGEAGLCADPSVPENPGLMRLRRVSCRSRGGARFAARGCRPHGRRHQRCIHDEPVGSYGGACVCSCSRRRSGPSRWRLTAGMSRTNRRRTTRASNGIMRPFDRRGAASRRTYRLSLFRGHLQILR